MDDDKTKDKSAKLAMALYGDVVFRLAKMEAPERWEALPSEQVVAMQGPDFAFQAWFSGDDGPTDVIVEMAAFPERRTKDQALRNVIFGFVAARRKAKAREAKAKPATGVKGPKKTRGAPAPTQLPEVFVVVLYPHGKETVPTSKEVTSRSGRTSLRGQWTVINLADLDGAAALATGHVGMALLAPLMKFKAGTRSEDVLTASWNVIESNAPPEELEELGVISQVLASRKYDFNEKLLSLLGRKAVSMVNIMDFPLAQKLYSDYQDQLAATVVAGLTDKEAPKVDPLVTKMAAEILPELKAVWDESLAKAVEAKVEAAIEAAIEAKALAQLRESLRGVLEVRFGPLPQEQRDQLEKVKGTDRTPELTKIAVTCPDPAAFFDAIGGR